MAGKPQKRPEIIQPFGYRLIALTRGQFARVNTRDFARISQFNWQAHWNPGTRSFYAVRSLPRTNNTRTVQWMHREIMGLTPYDPREVDHRNPAETLDNRRKNLRKIPSQKNKWNCRKRSDNKSGFKGVSLDACGKWRAQIGLDGRRIYLGLFTTARKAHQAYCEASRRLHGENGRTA